MRRAFTLIELLVAVAILVMVLGAAVSVEVNNIRLADRNQHYLQATNLAQEKLNLTKTFRDNNVALTPNEPFKDFPAIGKIVMPDYKFWLLDPAVDDTSKGQKMTIGDVDYYVKIIVTDVTTP